jgi:hypothetical protein
MVPSSDDRRVAKSRRTSICFRSDGSLITEPEANLLPVSENPRRLFDRIGIKIDDVITLHLVSSASRGPEVKGLLDHRQSTSTSSPAKHLDQQLIYHRQIRYINAPIHP